MGENGLGWFRVSLSKLIQLLMKPADDLVKLHCSHLLTDCGVPSTASYATGSTPSPAPEPSNGYSDRFLRLRIVGRSAPLSATPAGIWPAICARRRGKAIGAECAGRLFLFVELDPRLALHACLLHGVFQFRIAQVGAGCLD